MKKLLVILVLSLFLKGCGPSYNTSVPAPAITSLNPAYGYATNAENTEAFEGYSTFSRYDAETKAFNKCKMKYETGCKISSELFAKKLLTNSENQNETKPKTKKKTKPKTKKKTKKKSKPKDLVPAASGTGFFVSTQGDIVTNYHVIEGCDVVKVSYDGQEIKTITLAVDKKNDLAIIKASIKPKSVYPVSSQDAELLEDVIIAGYPLGKKVSSAIKTSKGSVTALAGFGDNYSEFQTDAALNQGNSGGPIMNQKGNVIGVAVANFGKKEGIESFNFGIKSSTLKTFAISNNLRFLSPNRRNMSNQELGKLITNGTVYLECWMTIAKINQLIALENNRKAFFSEYQ